jgi:hypothetical protein
MRLCGSRLGVQAGLGMGFGVALAMLTGCGGGTTTTTATGTTTPTPIAPGASSIYVVQNPAVLGNGSGTVLQFATTASGSLMPVTSFAAPASASFNSVAADSSNNLYVSTVRTIGTGEVLEYASGSLGSSAPLRDLTGALTQISAVDGVAASAGGEIFVAEDSGGIAAFSSTASGNIAPTRYILGVSQTGGGLSTVVIANAIVSDGADNLYVVNLGSTSTAPIVVFGPTATGNVAPIRTLSGPLTQLSTGTIAGVAIDGLGNLWVTTNNYVGSAVTASILEFAAGATGNVAPINAISGSQTTIGVVGGVRVDSIGDVFVVSLTGAARTPTILEFAPGATGNTSPILTITSTAWTNPDNSVSLAIH